MERELTVGQRMALRWAAEPGGIKKGDMPHSKYWRNIDQLERRGFVRRYGYGTFLATDAGRNVLRLTG